MSTRRRALAADQRSQGFAVAAYHAGHYGTQVETGLVNSNAIHRGIAPLAGACIVVTRPQGSASSMLRRIRTLQGSAVALPGLALRVASDLPNIRRALDAAHITCDWVFSSPSAVQFMFRVAPEMRISGTARVFAVGTGTARALARRGIRANAPDTRGDSESLLALPELADMRGRSVTLICAPGGRDLIAPTLRERGATVDAIHVYHREPPRLTRRHFDALARAPDPLITLISSAESLGNLVAQLPAPVLDRLRRQTLVVSSARLAAIARDAAFTNLVEATSAMAEDLLQAAAHALARHRL